MILLCAVIGYFCGCFLTADAVARRTTGKSAFMIGTKNPGMANIAAELGFKCAAVTLLGDILKTAAACVLCCLLFPSLGRTAILYAGVGAAVGHGFPFWHRFKGGRSVTVTCAYIVLFSPFYGIAAELVGLFSVVATGYLAVGALLIPVLYTALITLFHCPPDASLAALAGTALMFVLHRDSIWRMANGLEKKTDLLSGVREHK